MRLAGLKSQVGYKRPRHRSGSANVVTPNRLQRQFTTAIPDEAWVTDITYIRTHEGWLYLAVILSAGHRLVNAIPNYEGADLGCAAHGRLAASTDIEGHCTFRSG